jgi:hypothetical protein
MKPGYYLVTPDCERRFISATINLKALERMCDRHLTEKTGWQYWVDYLHGPDVFGNPHWSNWDHSDKFYDAGMRQCGAIE